MNHLSEEQLVLHYYGEDRDEAGTHLSDCDLCRLEYRTLQRVLNAVDSYPCPERAADYGARVWGAIESRIRPGRPFWQSWIPGWQQWAAAAALGALLAAAFLAGRVSVRAPGPPELAAGAAGAATDDRILLSAVGQHLDRTQMVLTEVTNAAGAQPEDIEDLLRANRLYRTSADYAGERGVAEVLDELERLLTELAHLAPSLDERQAGELRDRIRGQGILFKLRVVGDALRQRTEAPASDIGTTL